MNLPPLQEIQNQRDMISEFKGYNHNIVVSPNQFYDMGNMTADYYPVLSPRHIRGHLKTFTKPNGLFAKDHLCWVDGTSFCYQGEVIGTVTDTEKQFVSMGAYVLIFPDKKIFNTLTGDFDSLENTVVSTGTVTFTLSKQDGTAYLSYAVSETAPVSPTDGQLWIDISSVPHSLKQYSLYSETWVQVLTTYIKIAGTGIGVGFKTLDGITISGCSDAYFNNTFVIQFVSDDMIVVTGIADTVLSQETPITIKRIIPTMDFVTEMNNRIWGCSSVNHEIYACKLGDPFNWNCFAGLSTDSYALPIGSNGDFTGAAAHLGYVLFFKEDVIHKIYGSKPANYQLVDTNARGVEKGSHRSLVLVNETLYYKARNSVCSYEGSLPTDISADLGDVKYKNAVAGTIGNKYYISMQDTANAWHMFVFDQVKGTWHKEDATPAKYFARIGEELYYVNVTDKGLYSVSGNTAMYVIVDDVEVLYEGEDVSTEGNVVWFVQTGDMGTDSPDNKYISKVVIRLSIETGSSFTVWMQYDSSGVWEKKCTLYGSSKNSFTVPIIPKRCDHMKIKLSGAGDCKVYSISKVIEQGSEI